MLCLLPKSISDLLLVKSTLLLWEKLMFKFQLLNGKILADSKKPRNFFKKWSSIQLIIQRNMPNLVWSPLKVYFSTDPQVVVRPWWLKLLLMSVPQTSFLLKDQNSWQCGSVSPSPMSEISLTKPDKLLHVFSSLMSLILWVVPEVDMLVMPVVPVTELWTRSLPKWTV